MEEDISQINLFGTEETKREPVKPKEVKVTESRFISRKIEDTKRNDFQKAFEGEFLDNETWDGETEILPNEIELPHKKIAEQEITNPSIEIQNLIQKVVNPTKKIQQIIIFYDDNTFSTYNPDMK
jgi:hypothetical protein